MKFCPECGSELNGKIICEKCTYNLETQEFEIKEEYHQPMNIYISVDTTPKFGLMDVGPCTINQSPEMFCPECGTPLINKFTECPNCNFKREIKNSE